MKENENNSVMEDFETMSIYGTRYLMSHRWEKINRESIVSGLKRSMQLFPEQLLYSVVTYVLRSYKKFQTHCVLVQQRYSAD
jgi:hypothetical protein